MAKQPKKQLYLAGTDGSAASDKALTFAIERAKEAGARLHVVMVVGGGAIGAPSTAGGAYLDLMDEIRQEAQAIVEEGATRAKAAGVDAESLVVEHDVREDVASALVKYAEGRGVNTIFVGSHGRTGIVRVLLGSTAEKVVRLSHCAVSVVR